MDTDKTADKTAERIGAYLPEEIPYLRVLGRTDGCLNPLTLFWTASGIEFSVRAREVWVTVEADYRIFEPWIVVLVDGALSQRMMVPKGRHEICVFRGWNNTLPHEIRILRDTQAMGDDPANRLQIHSVRTRGEFCPLKPYQHRIEFIGDSLTSGEGLAGARGEMDWTPAVFQCTDTYAAKVAEAMNAEYNVISQSGWGIYCDWRGDTSHTIPRIYEQICGVYSVRPQAGISAEASRAAESWDFSAWKPEYVIVNLGSNDAASFDRAGEYFPLERYTCPMRRNADGSMNEEDRRAIEDAAYRFLIQLRRCNPDAMIIWCLGMVGKRLNPTIEGVVNRFLAETGDQKVQFLELPVTRPEEYGSREHPGAAAHQRVAEVILKLIQDSLLQG